MAVNMLRFSLCCALVLCGCFHDIVPEDDPATTGSGDEPINGTPPVPVESSNETGSTSDGDLSSGDPSEGSASIGDEGPRCGDGIRDPGEACDDGNLEPGDGCNTECEKEPHACADDMHTLGEDLEQGIGVCKDDTDVTCEQHFAQLCAPGWHLCSGTEHVLLNDHVIIDLGDIAAVGVIRCRSQGGSGHYTSHAFNVDGPDSCEIGSSRADCPTNLGCNEGMHAALCCAPIETCGNGTVDDPREECDDGNDDDLDACNNACASRTGSGPFC